MAGMDENIGPAGNTLVPAVLALESKGYCVSWTRQNDHDETWFAEGPLGRFLGDDPLELLGLIAMREIRGENWRATDGQIDEFMNRYDPDSK
jgi:hypothetical protein